MTGASDLAAVVAAYVSFYESLTPESLGRLDELCTPDVRFRDPFNDVTGITAYRAILAEMFVQVETPRFQVSDRALSGRVAYLRWDFTFKPKRGGTPWRIEGMSEVHFDRRGRVSAHLDYWDSGSQFYARLPVVGRLIGFVRKRLAVDKRKSDSRPRTAMRPPKKRARPSCGTSG